MTIHDAQITSPYASGGGGYTFEHKVSSLYLISLLAGDAPRGLDHGRTEKIEFQVRHTGILLDDLLIVASDDFGVKRLALQIRTSLTFSDENQDFLRVISAAWKTWSKQSAWEFQENRDRLAIAVGSVSGSLLHNCFQLPSYARQSASAESFFSKFDTPGVLSRDAKSYLEKFERALTRCSGRKIKRDEVYAFLRDLSLITFDLDLDPSTSRDYHAAIIRLNDLVAEHTKPANAIDTLFVEAAELAQRGGSIDAIELRRRLANRRLITSGPRSSGELFRYLEQIGFRRTNSTLLRDVAPLPPSPWPRSSTSRWPLWVDLEGGMVVNTSTYRRISDHLRMDSVAVLAGEPASGKSTLSKLLAFELETNNENSWNVFILEDRRLGSSMYGSFDPLEFHKSLISMSDQHLFLVMDDLDYAPDKALDFLHFLEQTPLGPNVRVLMIFNSSALTNTYAGEEIRDFARTTNRLFEAWLAREDILTAATQVLRHCSGNPAAEFPAEQYKASIRSIAKFCRGNWFLLRLFLQAQRYNESTGYLWPPSHYAGFVRRSILNDWLQRTTLVTISDEEQEVFWLVAALSAVGVMAHRAFFTSQGLLDKVRSLTARGFLVLGEDGVTFSTGHQAQARTFLEAKFGSSWQAIIDAALSRYLARTPPNYSDVLVTIFRGGHIGFLRRVLRSETAGETINKLSLQMTREGDFFVRSAALYSIYRADKDVARKWIQQNRNTLVEDLMLAFSELNGYRVALSIRNLRRIAREDVRSILESSAIPESLAAQLLHTPPVEAGMIIREFHQAAPKLANSLLNSLIDRDFEKNIVTALESTSLDLAADFLEALYLVDYKCARRLLENLGPTIVSNRFGCCDIRLAALALGKLAQVHPAFVQKLALEWLSDAEGEISTVLRNHLEDTHVSSFEKCELSASLSAASGPLGAWAAARVNLERLKRDWAATHLRLDFLGRAVAHLAQANRTQAFELCRRLDPHSIAESISGSFEFPKALGMTLITFTRISPAVARLALSELTRDYSRLIKSISNWIQMRQLEALATFLVGLAMAEEISDSQDRSERGILERIWVDIMGSLVWLLSSSINNQMLPEVGYFFSKLSQRDNLRQLAQNLVGRLGEIIHDAVHEERNSLDSLVELLVGCRKVGGFCDTIIEADGERLLQRFGNRMQHREGDLIEIGKFLELVGEANPGIGSRAVASINWDLIRSEAEGEASMGRIARFLDGLSRCPIEPDLSQEPTFETIAATVTAQVPEESEVSRISEVLHGLRSIDYKSQGFYAGSSIAEAVLASVEDQGLVRLLEVEPRVDRIARAINIITRIDSDRGSHLLRQLDSKVLASKLHSEGQLLKIVRLLQTFRLTVGSDSEWCSRFVEGLNVQWMAEVLGRDDDPGLIALCLRRCSSWSADFARSSLSHVKLRVVARRCLGIFDSFMSMNLTRTTSVELIRQLCKEGEVAKITSLLFVARSLRPGLAKSLLAEFQAAFASVSGTLVPESTSLLSELALKASYREMAWLVYEVTLLDRETGCSLGGALVDRFLETGYADDSRKQGGWLVCSLRACGLMDYAESALERMTTVEQRDGERKSWLNSQVNRIDKLDRNFWDIAMGRPIMISSALEEGARSLDEQDDLKEWSWTEEDSIWDLYYRVFGFGRSRRIRE